MQLIRFATAQGALLLALAAAARCQPPGAQEAAKAKPGAAATALGSIEGRVLKAATEEPLRGARVELSVVDENVGDEGQEALSDAEGKFSFGHLKPGTYRMKVRKAGYVSQEYGERPGGGRGRGRQGSPIRLLAGQKMRDIVFKLVAGAVVTGRIFDQNGDPIAEAEVNAAQFTTRGAQSVPESRGQAETNDRGEYRIYGLAPGQYIVHASPRQGDGFLARRAARTAPATSPPEAAAPHEVGGLTYYPGVLEAAQAARLEAKAGEEIGGIDITIRTVRVFAVRGKVILTEARDKSQVHLMLVSKEGVRESGGRAQAAADGSFEIPNVRPGAYMLMAMSINPEEGYGTQMSASQDVRVGDADVNDLRVTLGGGADVSGTLRIEGRTELPRFAMVMLFTGNEQAFGGGGNAQVKSDGTFTIHAVAPGTYSVYAMAGMPAASEYYMKEARLGGADVRDGLNIAGSGPVRGLEILLGADGGTVTGRVLNEDHLPVSGAQVLLLTPDAKATPLDAKHAESDQNGNFTVKGIRPGEYKIIALEETPEGGGRFGGADALKKYESKGKSLRVDAGSTQTVEVQALRPDRH